MREAWVSRAPRWSASSKGKRAHERKPSRFPLMHYSYLSASMGLSFAAFHAGSMPKKMPTPTEKAKARNTEEKAMEASKEKYVLTIHEPIQLTSVPMAPPSTLKTVDSTRNCSRMSRFFA